MKGYLIAFFMLFSLARAFCQVTDNSSRLQAIVSDIIYENQVDHEHVGMPVSLEAASYRTRQYRNFEELSKLASTEELVALTDSQNGVIACYASWALIDRNYDKMDEIFLRFLSADKYIKIYEGCERGYDYLTKEIYAHARKNKALVTKMDSIVIYTYHTNIPMLGMVLNHEMPVNYLARIEFLAFTWNRVDAVFYLHRHYKPEYGDKVRDAALQYWMRSEMSKKNINIVEQLAKILLEWKKPKVDEFLVNQLNHDRTRNKYEIGRLAQLFDKYGVNGLNMRPGAR